MRHRNDIVKYYTGIGSRETPQEVLDIFKNVAVFLDIQGYILRSGGAKGADKAFEDGCDDIGGAKEIYLNMEVDYEAAYFR